MGRCTNGDLAPCRCEWAVVEVGAALPWGAAAAAIPKYRADAPSSFSSSKHFCIV